ncbi:hypothetical protein CWI37_0712p0010 [Hamiltosporidium tvaerminnensis]|uniref:Uncharacterized protein n=1 Tax=Hamiltosporidium tvaerminnensis TaxID=1176355 RepID=A0A4Q9L321_9MICR|nr:hypothetical protein CWI37_0712p0010 [Hamiltosporidium tvaerminnensis]
MKKRIFSFTTHREFNIPSYQQNKDFNRDDGDKSRTENRSKQLASYLPNKNHCYTYREYIRGGRVRGRFDSFMNISHEESNRSMKYDLDTNVLPFDKAYPETKVNTSDSCPVKESQYLYMKYSSEIIDTRGKNYAIFEKPATEVIELSDIELLIEGDFSIERYFLNTDYLPFYNLIDRISAIEKKFWSQIRENLIMEYLARKIIESVMKYDFCKQNSPLLSYFPSIVHIKYFIRNIIFKDINLVEDSCLWILLLRAIESLCNLQPNEVINNIKDKGIEAVDIYKDFDVYYRLQSKNGVNGEKIVSFWSTMWNKNEDKVTYDENFIPFADTQTDTETYSTNHPLFIDDLNLLAKDISILSAITDEAKEFLKVQNNKKIHLALIKGFLKVKYRLVEEVTKKSLEEAQLAKLYNEIKKRKLHSKLYNARKNELVSVIDSSRWLRDGILGHEMKQCSAISRIEKYSGEQMVCVNTAGSLVRL